jgi:PAS domain S-box-containing protein
MHDSDKPTGAIVCAVLFLSVFSLFAEEDDDLRNRLMLESILKSAPTGIGVVENRVITQVNDYILDLTGYTRQELIGQSARILYPTQEDYDFVGREKYRQIAEKGTGSVETIWRRKDGEIRYVFLSSTPLDPEDLSAGVTFTVLDITDRKLAEKELRASEERFRKLFEDNAAIMLILDPVTGSIRDANPAAESFYGWPREILIAKNISEINTLTPGEIRDEMARARERSRTYFEFRHKRADGGIRDVAVQSSGILVGDEMLLFSIIQDITEQKKSERVLASLTWWIFAGSAFFIILLLLLVVRLAASLRGQRAAEREKLEAERNYRDIFDSSSNAVFVHDMDTGKILDVNARALSLFGYPDKLSVCRRTIADLSDTAGGYDIDKTLKVFQEAREKGTAGFEWRAKSSRGDLFWAQVTLTRMTIQGTERILAEARDVSDLKRRTSELEGFFTVNLDLLCIAGLDGRFISTNVAWSHILGYSTDELNGMNFLDFVHPEDLPATLGAMGQLGKGGEILNFTNRYRCRDGSYRFIEWRSHPKDNLIYAAARDVTERMQMEEALKASEKRLDLAMMVKNEGVWDWNLATNETYFDDRYYIMAGYTPGAFPQTFPAWAERVHPEDLPAADKGIKDYISGKTGIFDVEFRFKRNDVTWMWIQGRGKIVERDVDGTPLRMVGTHTDVTERRQAEEQLRKLSLAVEQSPASVVITDLDGCIEYVNPKFTQVTGYALDEVRGKNPRFLKSGELPAGYYQDLWKTITAGREWRGEFHNRKKSGEPFWESVSVSPIVTPEGRTTHYLAVKEDITEKKRVETELVKAKEKAEESSRLKTAFLQNMSHEIRTPMNAIIGFASLLPENFDDKEILREFSGIIEHRCEDLLEIINDILDISRIESGQNTVHTETFPINELFADLGPFFRDYQNRIGKQHISLVWSPLPGDLDPEVTTDKTKLRQILVNLIGNAFKFTDSGTVECGCRMEQGRLEFFVSDTGMGIPADKHDYVFERFAQIPHPSHGSSGGTGLGLSIVKGLVGLLGGEVWFESEPGRGTTFYFTIG